MERGSAGHEAWLDALLRAESPRDECPTIAELVAYRDGTGERRGPLAAHLATCGLCAEQFLLLSEVPTVELAVVKDEEERGSAASAGVRRRATQELQRLLNEVARTLLATPDFGLTLVRGTAADRDAGVAGVGGREAITGDGMRALLREHLRAGAFLAAADTLCRLRSEPAGDGRLLRGFEALCRAVGGEYRQARELLREERRAGAVAGRAPGGWPELLAAHLLILDDQVAEARKLLLQIRGKYRRPARELLAEID